MTPRRTDVYFTSKAPPSGSWLAPVRISANTTGDQLQPALDQNSVGDLLVPFYSRHEDMAFNSDYRNFYTVMSALGGFPNGQVDHEMKDEFGLDEWYAPPNQPNDAGFIGDYQDVWGWNFSGVGKFHSIWSAAPGVVRPTSRSDVMVTGISN